MLSIPSDEIIGYVWLLSQLRKFEGEKFYRECCSWVIAGGV